MRRTLFVSGIVALALLANSASAFAAGLAGEWSATIQGEQVLMTLKGSGPTYSGTFTVTTSVLLIKGNKKQKVVKQSSQPVTALVKQVRNGTGVLLTITTGTVKTPVSCALVKDQLRCFAPAVQQRVVFTHTKH